MTEKDKALEIRSVDEVARVVLPRSLRIKYEINEGDEIAFFDEGRFIGVKKYRSGCCVCGSLEELSDIGEKSICRSCMENLPIHA